MYRQCPFRYFLSYIKKVPQEKIEAMERGKEIHDMLDWFFDQPQPKNVSTSEIIDIFKKHELYEKHKQPIHNFIEFVSTQVLFNVGKENFIPQHELKIINNELNTISIVDAVWTTKKDEIMLVDYKTGKKHPIEDYVFELSFYAYFYEKEFGKRVDKVGIFFADANEFVSTDKILDENTIKSIIAYVRNNINSNKFKKKKSWMCKWCSVKKYCECGTSE